jgi:hypothetical protein
MSTADLRSEVVSSEQQYEEQGEMNLARDVPPPMRRYNMARTVKTNKNTNIYK